VTRFGRSADSFDGDVTAFEPSSEMFETIERTLTVNRVSDVVSVEHAAVGPGPDSNEQCFGPADGDQRPPSAVPERDVLDLDCEGAEVEILREPDVAPRVIVVEVHPHLGSSIEAVGSGLEKRGYEIVERGATIRTDDIPVLTAIRDGCHP
jgi:hypothetical protein